MTTLAASADPLTKARAAKARKQAAKRRHDIKQATEWLRLMREEAQARRNYMEADEPRAKERARKHWLHVRDEWHKIGTPTDDALREVRTRDRTDR